MAGKNEEKNSTNRERRMSLYGWMIVFIVIVNVIICNYISMARVYVLVFVMCVYEARVLYVVSRVYTTKRFGLSRVLIFTMKGFQKICFLSTLIKTQSRNRDET